MSAKGDTSSEDGTSSHLVHHPAIVDCQQGGTGRRSPQGRWRLQLRYIGPVLIVLAAFAIVVSALLTLSLADGSILTRRLSDGLEWAARHTLGRVGITSVDAYAGVRVRETPSEAGRTLGAIIAGDTVRILSEPQMVNGEMWVRVSWQQGELEGWIPVRFVKIDSR